MTTPSRLLSADREREALPNGCSCGHVTLAGREYARYVDPADMGERVLPTSFSLRTVHDAIRAIEAEAAALSSPETTPAGGTTTDCPLEGVHEHPFRGPHRFHEWDPANFAPGTPTPAGVLDEAALREALDGLWNAYSAYAGAAEGAGALQSRVVQRLVEAVYGVIVADKGHPGRLGRSGSET